MISKEIFTLFCQWYNEYYNDDVTGMKPSDYEKCKDDKIITDAISKWYITEHRDKVLKSILND